MDSKTGVLSRRGFLTGLLGSGLTAAEAPCVDLFQAGSGGYFLYRIPGLVVTRRGSVLTYCEARRHSGSDWDDIDLMQRRSTDGGNTFEPPWMLPHVSGPVERNPVANERQQAGRSGGHTTIPPRSP